MSTKSKSTDNYAMPINDAKNAGTTIEQVRREKLELLIQQYGSVTSVAFKLGHNTPAQVSQWRNAAVDSKTGKPRTISNASARLIESRFGKPLGWMDNSESGRHQPSGKVMTIQEIMGSLNHLLGNLRLDARKSVGGLLAVYIEDPRHGEQIANAIETIIKKASKKQDPP